MSRTVGILFVTWLCIFSVSEAEYGASCSVDDLTNCTATSESCIEGSCNCSNGYSYIDNECKSSAITVSLSPSSNSVLHGSEVTLTASITSDVPVSNIIWQRVSGDSTTSNLDTNLAKYNQTGDVGRGTVKLTIKGLVFEDKGNYQVEVTNNAGTKETSNQVSIDVTGGTITVTLSPSSSSVVYGSDAVLTPSVTSDVPVGSIIWQKVSDGTAANLTTNQDKYIQSGDVVSGSVTLTIKSLVFQDKGSYQVLIINNAGTKATSNQVSIDVTGGTITVSLSTSSSSVVYGSDAVLTPSVTSDVPVGSIIWQKVSDGTAANITTNLDKYIQSGDVGSGSVTLTIKSLVFQDKGSYQVLIINNAGTKKTSNQVSIDVTGGTITVSLSPLSSSVVYGSDAVLTASVTSDVAVGNIIWQKVLDGTAANLTTNLDKYIQSGEIGSGYVTLTIKSLVFQDKGSYQVLIINNAGTKKTSNQVSINVTGGQLTVSTGGNVSGKFNGSVTIDCTVTGPELNNIHWIKYPNNVAETITIDNSKYTGGSITTKALTINNLNTNDATEYQCQARNPGGTYGSHNRATVTVVYTELAPIITGIVSTTSTFTVFWNHPTSYYNLISEYEVKWKVSGALQEASHSVNKTLKQHTVSSGLVSGQLYTVYVISHVNFLNPQGSISVNSNDTTIRLVPKPPGPININESIFTYNNLNLTWDAPINTIFTKYEVTLDGLLYVASSNVFTQFNKNFVPGKYYYVSIVTVSGTTTDKKKSTDYSEWIRITPTKPGPPTDVLCPQNPLDISLEISWTAPSEPNGLILRYQINVSPRNPGSQIYTSSNKTMKNVDSLIPEQLYIFTVQTINDADDSISNKSQSVACKTKAGVSSAPTDFKIDDIQNRGFRIDFKKPDNVKGILAAYKIIISKEEGCVQQILVHGNCSLCKNTVGCQSLLDYTVSNITSDVSYNVSGLDPYTYYTVKVVAINGKGEGHPVNTTIRTDEEVPLQPGQINASVIQSSSLELSWTLPDPSPGNTTYTIYTYEGSDDIGTNFLMKEPAKVYGFDTKTLSVTGLEEYWPYKFKVDAATVKGNKTSDFSKVFRTKQAEPGQVLNLTVQQKGNEYNSAYVSWSPPALRDRNGVLKSYLFSVNRDGTEEEVEIPILLIEDIVEKKIPVIPEAVYIIKVVLQNNESMTSIESMQSYKAPAGPPPVTDIKPITTTQEENKPTTNTIPLNINTTYFNNDENGKQVFGGIAVCAEPKCKDVGQSTIKSVWESLPNWHKAKKQGFPLYRVTNDTFLDTALSGDSRKKRSTTASTLPFIIGEDITCSSLNEDVYCNGPLNPGTSYIVIIFACTNGGCTYYKTAEPYITAKKIEVPQDIPIGLIAGVVVAVVVVAVIVGVAFVVVRRRNRLGETKQYTKGIDNPTSFDEPVPKNIPRKRPIKLKELSDKVAEKHKDSNLHFAREYEDLKALSPKHPAETSELDNNKLKNRYVNILPFDHSRVKLMLTEDDDPSTDFINANYLPGYKSQREYIATQGPIPGTIDDFWRMIWEQNVSIIVMLTLCKEEGRVKCEMYWPENIHEPKQYGDLVVETVSNSTVNFYEFRIFKIKLGDTTRSVKHFHFLQWKDFSANVQNDVMIDFIKNVRNHIRPPDMNGPVVVHCSAGVGRTGTYCALDHLFQFVDEHDLDESIDIFDLVMNLRERRMFMVQTEQQYIFIHDCLKDYLEKKLAKDECLYENQAFVADDEPVEESLYQNYSNQRTDL